MEFRAPMVAAEQNENTIKYFTKNLVNPEPAQAVLNDLISDLGNAVEGFPDWHPILTIPNQDSIGHVHSLHQLNTYDGIDHTVNFVRGFITCPYSEDRATQLLDSVNLLSGLHAYQLPVPLYADNAYPVVVKATEVELEADGTILSCDALRWFVEQTMKEAKTAIVAETWWNIRSLTLGCPHGSRSSLFVNQHTGIHMRKILEALNNSGMFGPIKEISLDMLSKTKRERISKNLISNALQNWDKCSEKFKFKLRGEDCKVEIRDVWEDGHELSIRVEIGKHDLYVSGFYYGEEDRITHTEPQGKRVLAEKFL